MAAERHRPRAAVRFNHPGAVPLDGAAGFDPPIFSRANGVPSRDFGRRRAAQERAQHLHGRKLGLVAMERWRQDYAGRPLIPGQNSEWRAGEHPREPRLYFEVLAREDDQMLSLRTSGDGDRLRYLDVGPVATRCSRFRAKPDDLSRAQPPNTWRRSSRSLMAAETVRSGKQAGADARAGRAAMLATTMPVIHARLRTPGCANRDVTSTRVPQHSQGIVMAEFTPPGTPRTPPAPPVSNWIVTRWGRSS